MKNLKGARVTVYCAGSTKVNPIYLAGAERLAKKMNEAGAELVFGGGKTGLMGHIATQVIQGGGVAHAVMPHFLKDIEMNHPLVEDFIFVDTMSERKQLLLAHTEGLIALPGGCGTLEELLEAITLKRLGQYLKPIIIVNQEGFYTPQLEMLKRMVDEDFMRPEHLNLWTVVNDPSEAIDAIRSTADWDADALQMAVNN
ncbi:MAG: TIGR00730 family Rossman fold protein [Schleiferiaceae bacterium]|nr:TIGR00730 family Rossman fold protein [Schleiferiaceae bacterium]